jgi:uncharacterized protein YrrD
MKTTHVKGLSVVSIGTGEKLGNVSEILLDSNADRITALAVETGGGGGMLSSQPSDTKWLAADDVHAIGPDALTVRDASVLSDAGGDSSATTAISLLMDEKVVTEGGTFVGKVVAVEIDPTSLAVTGLEVSSGFLKSNQTVAKADLLTVGEELVIVADSVGADQPTETAMESETEARPTITTEVYEARGTSANE